MDQFLLFGDSITQQSFSQEKGFGFGAALADAYIRRLDVVNRGLSGYNSRQARQVLPSIIPKPDHARLRLMTIFLGANDARLPNSPGGPQQHVPLDEYVDNLRAIIAHPSVKAHPDVRLILITPPPVDERNALQNGRENHPNEDVSVNRRAATTAQYAHAVRELGAELHLPVLDLWLAMIGAAGGRNDDKDVIGALELPASPVLQSFLHDGLHFTPDGYKVLYTELMGLIKVTWPDQLPENLPFVLPAWDDPEASQGHGVNSKDGHG